MKSCGTLAKRLQRRGMTLMEIIVALGLSVALMALIGSALQFYAITLNQRDEQVRRSLVARGVMAMISSDLRACVWSEPQDLQVVGEMLSSANGQGAALASGLGATSATGSADSSGTDDSMAAEEGSDTLLDLAVNYSSTTRPGLIGSTSEILFDVSRLPRVDQMAFNANVPPSELQDIPSDLKTVSYHVQAAAMGGVTSTLSTAGQVSEAGLVRRVLDREASRYANQLGDVTRLIQTGSLVAPEVEALEFAYWDGTMWLTSWHSDDMGSLPLAIRVKLYLQAKPNTDPTVVSAPEMYETIVRLPMASAVIPEPVETTDATMGTTVTTGQGTGSSSAGSSNGATGR